MDEDAWFRELNETVKKDFGIDSSTNVPATFVDVRYGNEVQEEQKFEEGLTMIENCLKKFPAYPCKNFNYPQSSESI